MIKLIIAIITKNENAAYTALANFKWNVTWKEEFETFKRKFKVCRYKTKKKVENLNPFSQMGG